MAEFRERYGNWALVAGAAIGLGESFCTTLAKQGFNLFMIDNREDQVTSLADKLAKEYNIQTIPFFIDLFQKDAVSQIMENVSAVNIRLMIYVAAYSQIKRFGNYTPDDLDHYINVNVGTPIKLVHAFSNRLIEEKKSGGILLMSSLAGLLGMQYIVPYAASKAFTWNLAESLHHELKPHKIDVMACIAGATATEAYLGTNPQYGFIKPQVQQPSEVAELALKRIGKKALFIPGFSNRLNYFILTRILPRKIASYFANKTMEKMYSENVTCPSVETDGKG
jgi:short-subunit dehydrogenase